jgi:hypothetical protein
VSVISTVSNTVIQTVTVGRGGRVCLDS